MNLPQTPTSVENPSLSKLLFPRSRYVRYQETEQRLTKKPWLLLQRLFRSPDRTLSLGEASEAAHGLEPVWPPNKKLRIANMRNMASKINQLLRKSGMPYKVRFRKEGRRFELVCLLETEEPRLVVPAEASVSSISRAPVDSVERCETVIVDPREIDDILPRLKPAFDDIFARKNDITVADSCCILIAVVSNRPP